MKYSLLQRWLKDIPISRKLYFTVGIMTVLIFIELGALWFSISNLSAVRAYVNGEGLWSKHQKDGIFYLREYAYTRSEGDFQTFKTKMKVPLGDKTARIELEKENPNYEIARQGFLDGKNNPEDVAGLIRIFRQFRNFYYIDRAIDIWTETDPYLDQVIGIGDSLHAAVARNASDSEMLAILRKLEPINHQISILEDDFSNTLGDGSRWLESIVLRLLLALTFSVELTGIFITISVSRGIEKGLKEVLKGTKLVTRGELDTRVQVYSKDEIGELANHFNMMTNTIQQKIAELQLAEENIRKEKERAEASEKVKQLFLANMSHEIRTPMNAILGFARLMEDSSLNSEQKEYIQAIVQSGDNLLVILNDILDFSKIEAGKISFEETPFKLNDLINAAITMVKPKAISKKLELTYVQKDAIPAVIAGDPVRLSQILLNLLSNAIKFTERGSITVSTHIVNIRGEITTVGFSIKDTGIGIPRNLQDRIFESFEQATAGTARKFGGTGLGLSIVKQLVELQGGRVWVVSDTGQGAEFSFTLPFKIKPGELVVKQKETIYDYHIPVGIRILVAEDNTVNQLLVARVLEKQGFSVDIAGNGVEALDKLNSTNYDLVIMDLQMPEMDGYETTTRIRGSESTYQNIPIMAMTAHTIKGEIEKCLALGMTDFISKPFDSEELKKKILGLLKLEFYRN